MTKIPLELVENLVDACKAGASEATDALSRALESKMQVAEVTAHAPTSAADFPEELCGAGLACVFQFSGEGIALLLAETTNLLPSWYAAPHPTGEAQLQTLAQELSLLLLPEDLEAEKFEVVKVDDLSAAVAKAGVADSAGLVELTINGETGNGSAYIVWPLSSPDSLVQPSVSSKEPAQPAPPASQPPASLESLPSYSLSLLNVHVPAIVTLAEKKMNVEEIVRLGPGAIIQFEKLCDSALELEIGGRTIASGEAVKVGEKFGLRLTSIQLPAERPKVVQG